MTFSTRNFDPLTPLAPKFPNLSLQNKYCFFARNTLLQSSHMHMHYKILHHLGMGCCLPKTTFRTKVGGGWAIGEHLKIWDHLRISATVEASNFKFCTQIGFGTSLPKMTFRTKITGGIGWGAHKKLGPPTYFCNR